MCDTILSRQYTFGMTCSHRWGGRLVCFFPETFFVCSIVDTHIDNDLSQYSHWRNDSLHPSLDLNIIGGSREEEGENKFRRQWRRRKQFDSGSMRYTSRHPITFLKVDKTIFFQRQSCRHYTVCSHYYFLKKKLCSFS